MRNLAFPTFPDAKPQVHADIDTVKVVVKNVPDYAAGKEKNDLGFLTFDLQVRLRLFLYLFFIFLLLLTTFPRPT